MFRVINRELADIYIKLNILTEDIINGEIESLQMVPERIDLSLLHKGIVNEEQNAQVYQEFFGIEALDIDKIGANDHIVRLVTQEFVEKHNILPITIDSEGKLLIVIANPFDYTIFGKIKSICKSLSKYSYRIVISTVSKIQKIQSVIFSKASTKDAIEQYELNDELKALKEELSIESSEIVNSPAVKLVESIIREGIAVSSSDIHIEPFEKVVKVRYRIDGALYTSSSFDIEMYPAVSTRIKILGGINIAERRIPQDGRIKYTLNGIKYDFRVSTLPTVYGERIVIRILDTKAFDFTRDKLGFFDEENSKIDRMVHLPYGIILLTGPTGCGKSTTLYSFVRELTGKELNIITVEDPVEYTIEGVNQVQVNTKANLTFAAALRSILRQDPNVIMIGEIRDEETAEIAIRSAITGHLVFSTLHTNDAPGAVTRLVDMGVQPYFVSDALSGVIAQRLVRKLCPHCKKSHETNEKEMKVLKLEKPVKIYEPCGCPACNNTGYKGRVGIHEVLVVDEEMKVLIQSGGTTEQIRALAKKNGMLSLSDTCKRVVLNGETSIHEYNDVIFENDY